jgi:hypothetical protein
MAEERVIVLRGAPEIDEQNVASAAITPGHLIEIDSNEWRPHGTAAGAAAKVFALERDELGKDIDEAYAIGDYVKAGYFHQGDRVNALVASGQTITEGEFLESAGDGTLRAFGSGVIVATAAEDATTTALTRVAAIVI